MGHASKLRPIYLEAFERVNPLDGSQTSQDILSQIFGEQEMSRNHYCLLQDNNREFGIPLDYNSSIIQDGFEFGQTHFSSA
jgi:hypothetical protein